MPSLYDSRGLLCAGGCVHAMGTLCWEGCGWGPKHRSSEWKAV